MTKPRLYDGVTEPDSSGNWNFIRLSCISSAFIEMSFCSSSRSLNKKNTIIRCIKVIFFILPLARAAHTFSRKCLSKSAIQMRPRIFDDWCNFFFPFLCIIAIWNMLSFFIPRSCKNWMASGREKKKKLSRTFKENLSDSKRENLNDLKTILLSIKLTAEDVKVCVNFSTYCNLTCTHRSNAKEVDFSQCILPTNLISF